jgi:hypothetical protein
VGSISASADIITSAGFSTRNGIINLGGTFSTRTGAIVGQPTYLEIAQITAHPILFSTNGSAKMAITSDGKVGIGTVSPYARLDVISNVAADTFFVENTNTGLTGATAYFKTSRSAGTDCLFIWGVANVTNTFRVYNNGNVQNTNNSYSGISDVKLKENIVDATPKLEKLMNVRVVNYNFKENLGYEPFKQLGVIAQEVEKIFPGLVEDTPDRDEKGKKLGTTTKSVKMSVFVPILIKAIQEQQTQIEELKLQVATLLSGSIN